MVEKHSCKRIDIVWDKDPKVGSENLLWEGTCPVCGKKYQQVFIEVADGLWDVEAETYVQI